MFLHKTTALAIVACLAVADAAANSTCYYPNGRQTKGGACNANADVSLCCGPTYICLSNGLCKPGPDTKRDMKYPFYRHGCTDPTYNSTVCPTFCTSAPFPSNTGQGVSSCGNNKYCCGRSNDCCADETNIFALPEAEVVTTILASSSFSTDSAGSRGSLEAVKHSNALAIGLGVGLGVGGFLLLALGVLYMLKRRARAKRHDGYEKKEEASEMDGSFSTELPDTSPEPAPSKVGYSAPVGGVVHEIGEGGAGPSIPPQELEARPRYDWEPRNEPEPRDGGFRPVDHDRHPL